MKILGVDSDFSTFTPDVLVLMRRWSKKAQTIVDNGKLKVWE